MQKAPNFLKSLFTIVICYCSSRPAFIMLFALSIWASLIRIDWYWHCRICIIHYQSCFLFHCLKALTIEKAGSRKKILPLPQFRQLHQTRLAPIYLHFFLRFSWHWRRNWSLSNSAAGHQVVLLLLWWTSYCVGPRGWFLDPVPEVIVRGSSWPPARPWNLKHWH